MLNRVNEKVHYDQNQISPFRSLAKALFKSAVITIKNQWKVSNLCKHGLRTPDDSINQRYLKNWADVAD